MAFTKIAAAGIGSTETVTLHSLEVLNNATVGGVLTLSPQELVSWLVVESH
jgi:hypothetical protein